MAYGFYRQGGDGTGSGAHECIDLDLQIVELAARIRILSRMVGLELLLCLPQLLLQLCAVREQLDLLCVGLRGVGRAVERGPASGHPRTIASRRRLGLGLGLGLGLRRPRACFAIESVRHRPRA